MSILTPISRGCKGTLTDGSVRYMIEFGPLEAVAAATLFGMPGTEMGVVALKDGHEFETPPGKIPTLPEMRAILNGQQNTDLGDEKARATCNDEALPMANDQADHTEDMPIEFPSRIKQSTEMPTALYSVKESASDWTSDMGKRVLNANLPDETHCRSPNEAALTMANEECSAGGFISALADQLADAGETIVETPMEIAQRGLVKLAGILSSDSKFWEYVGTMHPATPTNAGEAASYIRRECSITSRSELAHDARAAIYFRGMMRGFDEWNKK